MQTILSSARIANLGVNDENIRRLVGYFDENAEEAVAEVQLEALQEDLADFASPSNSMPNIPAMSIGRTEAAEGPVPPVN